MPPFASFVDQTKGYNELRPSGVVGDKEKKGKEERRERKKKEKVKEVSLGVLLLCLPRGTTKRTWVFFNFSR